MLAMYSNLACDNWVELLPFVQLAHNTAYSKALEETPHYLVFGRAATLPVERILGGPSTDAPQSQLDYSRRTVKNLQLAYELARRNFKEHADRQAVENEKFSFPCFKMGDSYSTAHTMKLTDPIPSSLVLGMVLTLSELSSILSFIVSPNQTSRPKLLCT